MKSKIKRPCTNCEEKFDPHSKYTRLCEDCWELSVKNRGERIKKAFKKVYECEDCGETFRSIYNYNLHKKKEHIPEFIPVISKVKKQSIARTPY